MNQSHPTGHNDIWIDAIRPYADPGDVFPAQAADEFFPRNPGGDTGRLTMARVWRRYTVFQRVRDADRDDALMARVRGHAMAEQEAAA